MNASEILEKAASTIKSRGEERDKGSERSMKATVTAFNALTGHNITETQGWEFMTILKLARAEGGSFKLDDYLDGAAYMALAGECEQNSQEPEEDVHETIAEELDVVAKDLKIGDIVVINGLRWNVRSNVESGTTERKVTMDAGRVFYLHKDSICTVKH